MAISPSASTPASHASILTGLNPYQHGVRVIYAEDGYRLPEAVPTLGTILKDGLWQTGAFVSSFTVSSFYGFDRGFDTFDEGAIDPSEESFVPQEEGFWAWSVRRDQRRSDETTDEAISWINQAKQPFFAWVHYWDPHDGVIVPPAGIMQQFVTSLGDQIERMRETYRAEVYFMDSQFGRLIRWLKKKEIYDETIIVVVADHGEGLGDHNWWSHRILYQEQIHVPLIMRIPGWPTGGVVDELVRTTDIVPTVLERLGIESPPGGVVGSSLSGLVRGRSEAPRVAYADAINLFDLNASMVKRRPDDGLVYCAMDREWKLMHRPLLEGKDELYNLSADPREQRNLVDFETAQADRLKKALDQFDGYVEKPFGDALDPKVLERLRSLGYIGNE
jgi:arylsulfatase A-like enzyme